MRIPPYHYLHVLDQNSNVTRLEIGPRTFVRQDHEKVIVGPAKNIIIPPRQYCIIENPVVVDEDNKPVFDDAGQAKLRHADREIRLSQEPFPLYPGEALVGAITPLAVVKANSALRLRAIRDVKIDGVEHRAGDEWLFEGPGTYLPDVSVEVVETTVATIIAPNQALRLRARLNCVSRDGKDRVAGEEWIVSKSGAYLPGVYEEVVDLVHAIVLTDKVALHLKALRTFTDAYGKVRKNGEEWLVTSSDAESHIPAVYEEVVNPVNIITLTNRQYCVISNPVGEDGKPQLGKKKLVKGEKSFFLQAGENLESGIQDIFILSEEEGIVLRAIEEFEETSPADGKKTKRKPGDRWMVLGPCEYFPPVQVEVVHRRKAIALDENEGVYVRDITTGRVRAVNGQSYMLKENEELWAKELPPEVEALLTQDALSDRTVAAKAAAAAGSSSASAAAKKGRDRTYVVAYRVPHNAAVQIYDYKQKKARVEFGPELVMLQPDEQFTQLNLSGGKPKRPNQIRSLCLLLGPDFCTDIITIETSDHARLSLQLSYSWNFEVDAKNEEDKKKIFSVPDFIGDACKAIASRIRGAVASVAFDDFHKNSAKIIRTSVFGVDEQGKVKPKFLFPSNNLVITSIDIQSVEPVDQRTRDALQKSVQLAIEITTNSQEATAKHEAERVEQEAKGRLERQRIDDEAQAERARKSLLELQAASAAVESTGQAKAEASARAEAAQIEGEAAVKQAQLRAQAAEIEATSELERLKKAREAELTFIREQNEIEIHKAQELSSVETDKFKKMVESIGTETLVSIAQAGPEMQVKLLQGLGIKSTLITDGKSPINLFNTANGLIGNGAFPQ